MDRLLAMRTFIAIARCGSLSAAARATGEPLTTISRRLAQLEDHIGTPLIARTTRSLSLTPQGRAYLAVCENVSDEIEAIETDLAGTRSKLTGLLTLTAPIVFGRIHVLPLLEAFLTDYPGVTANLVLADHNLDLATETVDVAIRIGSLPSSSLIKRQVGAVRMVTAAAPAYLEQFGVPRKPVDLSDHHLIAFASRPDALRWRFRSRKQGTTTIRITPRLAVNTAEAAIDAAIAGLGIVRTLSYQTTNAITAGQLIAVLQKADDAEIPVQLLRPPSRIKRPLVMTFLDFLEPRLAKRLAKS